MATFIKVNAQRAAGAGSAHISINTDLISFISGTGPEYKIVLKPDVVLPGFSKEGISITIPQGDHGKQVQLGLI